MKMNLKSMVPFLIGLLVLAILFPIGLSTLVTTQINETYRETDTAVENASTPEVITVAVTPYITDTVTVKVNATPTSNFTETSPSAGTVTLDAAESDIGDTILTSYSAKASGIVSTIWELLPIMVGVGLLFLILAGAGLLRRGRSR